ncbi:hypothetical protein, partial [Xenorhabdus littoralis]|uniref:hypothetical protein n=1 Tax=Xenorhabdus littoralis TaxID=2582835 RepID=UPI0029E8157B
YFSEQGALNKLAYIRAQWQFDVEGKKSNFPDEKVTLEDGTPSTLRGNMRPEFMERQARLLEELAANVKRERDLIRTKKKHSEVMEKHRKTQDELIALGNKILQLQSK